MIVLDEFPQLMKYKVQVMVIMETIFFLSGLPFTCNSGIHLFTLIDQRGTVGSLWCCIAQVGGNRGTD